MDPFEDTSRRAILWHRCRNVLSEGGSEMRNLRAILVLAAIVLELTACYAAVQPQRPTPEPLIPTLPAPAALPPLLAPAASATPAVGAAPPPGSTAPVIPSPQRPSPSPAPSATPQKNAEPATAWGLPASARGRIGVGATVFGSIDYDWGTALPGWWLNWSISPRPPLRPEIPFVRMVLPKGETALPQPGGDPSDRS